MATRGMHSLLGGSAVPTRRRRSDSDPADDLLVTDDCLTPATGIGAPLFALIALGRLLDRTPGAQASAVLAAVTSVLMALGWWGMRRGPHTWMRRHAPQVGLAFGLLLCASPLFYMVVTGVTFPPIGITLAVVAVGALLPDRFGALFVIGLATTGWVVCALAYGIPVPLEAFAFMVLSTLALAVLLHLAWSRTRGRLQTANRLVTQMAVTDSLTGLVNHRGFQIAGDQAMRRTAARATEVSVLFLDVDGLKEINDRDGHNAGDEVLRRVGRAIRESVRAWDVVARLGGDEFAVILEDCSVAELDEIGRRLREAMHAESVSASTGSATTLPGDCREGFGALVHAADAAMYAQKAARKAARQVRGGRSGRDSPPTAPEPGGRPPSAGHTGPRRSGRPHRFVPTRTEIDPTAVVD